MRLDIDDRCPQCLGTGKASPEDVLARSMRIRREELGLSMDELARKLANRGMVIDSSGLSRMETGKRSIRLNEAALINEILEMTS